MAFDNHVLIMLFVIRNDNADIIRQIGHILASGCARLYMRKVEECFLGRYGR